MHIPSPTGAAAVCDDLLVLDPRNKYVSYESHFE